MKNRVRERLGSKNGNAAARAPSAGKQASAQVAEQAAAVQRSLQQLGETIVEHVRRRPAASLAIAAACGVALGWLIKRR